MRKLSTGELKTNGTYRPDRHTPETPTGNLLKKLPPPPFALAPEAAKIYRETGEILVEQKMLKASDLQTLAVYASEMGVYVSEMEAAREEGVVVVLSNGVTAVSHHRRAAETALKNVAALADRLGLTPAARYRLKGGAAFNDEEPGEKDFLAEIIRQYNGC